jgi:uncharacterized protein YbjT (DUF2867 family)
MRILLTGSNGFIGRRLRDRLIADGHDVVCVVRDLARPHPGCTTVVGDFTTAAPQQWHAHLRGIDAVVNAVGIFRERGAASFAAVHTRGPIALFEACVAAGVRRVIQVSALGADADAPTEFLRSKCRADLHLLGLPLDATIVQPSLVFGVDGASTGTLLALASLPLLPLPGDGQQQVQPVHVDDLVAALVALLTAAPDAWRARRIAAVGPQPLGLQAYLETLRAALRLPPPRTWHVPGSLVRSAAAAGALLPGALFDRDAWDMLQRGNVAASDDLRALLGAPPRPASRFVPVDAAAAVRDRAQLTWLLPLLRVALAVLWIATAIVSFGVFPVEDSLALLARAGVPAALRPWALGAAATLDLVLGVLCVAPLRRRRWLWAAQALLIVVYTAILTVRLPEFWLHPFGPLTKNIPLLALLGLLWTLDRPQRER